MNLPQNAEPLLEQALLGCFRLAFMAELRQHPGLSHRYAVRLQREMAKEIQALEAALAQLQDGLMRQSGV